MDVVSVGIYEMVPITQILGALKLEDAVHAEINGHARNT